MVTESLPLERLVAAKSRQPHVCFQQNGLTDEHDEWLLALLLRESSGHGLRNGERLSQECHAAFTRVLEYLRLPRPDQRSAFRRHDQLARADFFLVAHHGQAVATFDENTTVETDNLQFVRRKAGYKPRRACNHCSSSSQDVSVPTRSSGGMMD